MSNTNTPTPKFTVRVWADPALDGEAFRIIIRNRKGREWISKDADCDLGNISEEAMVLEEVINDGVKLSNPDHWMEWPEWEAKYGEAG